MLPNSKKRESKKKRKQAVERDTPKRLPLFDCRQSQQQPVSCCCLTREGCVLPPPLPFFQYLCAHQLKEKLDCTEAQI